MGEKINDMLQFVTNQDNIWELIGNEENFKDGRPINMEQVQDLEKK